MTHATSAARWLMRRALFAVLVVAGVTTLTFVLIHLAPGDPIYLLAGDGGNASYYDSMRAKYGLDRTIAEQFVRYVRAVLSGDFGYSFMYQQPVIGVVLEHLPATMLLGGTSLLFSVILGFGAAVLCAIWRSRWLDAAVRGVSSVAYSAPVYWTGQVFILIAAVKLGVLPSGGMSTARESLEGIAYVVDLLWHVLLPAFTLSLPLAAVIVRVSRASMMETLGEPHVRAAVARGLGRSRLILRHVAWNASIPVVALVGQHAGQLLAGAALTEALFGWPGVGHLVLHAGAHRDYPLVTAAFIFISASVVFFNVVTDAATSWLDPRIRLT
ncbi:MAG TPA: ABC transporter permease [Vicinamibacterales bacterium]|nr:ABC transporter permease [Vicinamibacterales bacterium]